MIIQSNPEAFSKRLPVHTVTNIDRSTGFVTLSGSDGSTFEARVEWWGPPKLKQPDKRWGPYEITLPDIGSKVQLLPGEKRRVEQVEVPPSLKQLTRLLSSRKTTMPEGTRTEGEIAFEKYLNFQHIPFEFEKKHPGKNKKPDFTIEWETRPIVFDVKDFDPTDDFHNGGAFDPYPPIRQKIAEGRKKFKEYKEYCCGLVLFNRGRLGVFLGSPNTMLGSMYGDAGFTFPVKTETGIGDFSRTKRTFLGRGMMIRPHWRKPDNTTIAAIVTVDIIRPFWTQFLDLVDEDRTRDWNTELRQTIPDYDPNLQVPRVIVWHNAFARIPFPANLFCGDYDTHFGAMGREHGVTYEGSKLPDSLRLSKRRTMGGRPKSYTG
jgi:hypothetical protein